MEFEQFDTCFARDAGGADREHPQLLVRRLEEFHARRDLLAGAQAKHRVRFPQRDQVADVVEQFEKH
ncbi:MAG: hypothetical protein H0V54_04140 [Chthoniobacterales bacterium]|nr:hypothetical protein [Chthoniobacterales bacterium]